MVRLRADLGTWTGHGKWGFGLLGGRGRKNNNNKINEWGEDKWGTSSYGVAFKE